MQINSGPRVDGYQKYEAVGGVFFVRTISWAIGMLAAVAATGASAQSINLTYKCIQICRQRLVGYQAFATQNGPNLSLLNEAGEPSRAWPDWFAPATRIWVGSQNQGAVYSQDGMLIQFDNGTIWQRDLGLPPPPTRRRR